MSFEANADSAPSKKHTKCQDYHDTREKHYQSIPIPSSMAQLHIRRKYHTLDIIYFNSEQLQEEEVLTSL